MLKPANTPKHEAAPVRAACAISLALGVTLGAVWGAAMSADIRTGATGYVTAEQVRIAHDLCDAGFSVWRDGGAVAVCGAGGWTLNPAEMAGEAPQSAQWIGPSEQGGTQ